MSMNIRVVTLSALLAAIASIVLLAGIADATKWVISKKIDPISGEEITVQEIMSYTSDMKSSPSRYDMIFFPLTDERWIWLSPASGYASFGNDFSLLKEEEKTRLSKWLKENYDPSKAPNTYDHKLAWLEKIYGQRDKNEVFWCRFYRVMAYAYRNDNEKSIEYVRKALPLLNRELETKPGGVERIEVLYLLGEYSRRTGQERAAREYFEQVKTATYKTKKGEEKIGHPFFLELVKDREQLMNK
jgi:hypothetical protein